MKLSSSAQTHAGKVRKQNEDAHFVDTALGLHVVCDGVGGHASGDVASKTATQTIAEQIGAQRTKIDSYRKSPSAELRGELVKVVERAIQAANTKIMQMAASDPKLHGMGTTAEVALVVGGHLIVGHVGDSRTYLVRGPQVHLLTEDHKVSAEMRRSGEWSEADAKKSPYANVLTRALGMQEFVRPDLLKVELTSGDRIILCSDGLHDYLAEPKDLGARIEKMSADQIPAALVDFACQRGGKDNVTVVAIEVGQIQRTETTEPLDALKKSATLGKVPLFRYFTYPELLKLLSITQVQTYEAGDILMNEGEPSDTMLVTASGTVEVVKSGQIVARKEKGEFFGEMGLFDQLPRSASIRAAEPTTALLIHRSDLIELLRKETQIAVKFLWSLNQELNHRLRHTTQELVLARSASEPDTEVDLPFLA